MLCTFLYTGEQLAANPMQLVGRPKLAKSLPKALPRTAVEALLETVAQDQGSKRQTDWAERDLAIFVAAVAGVGLDVRLAILETLSKELGARFEPPAILRKLVAQGRLGKKVGLGFYRWTESGPVPEPIE